MKLKQGCSIYSDYGLNISAEEYADEGVPIIRTSDVDNSGALDLSNTKFVEPHVVGTKRLRKGDVLFSRSGTIGRAMVFDADLEATYAAYLVRFRPHPKRLLSKFIGYWAQSAGYWHQIGADTIQSTIGNFNANKFANLSIPEHDLPAQRAIADFLDRETARIDLLIQKKQRLVALQSERRQSTLERLVLGGAHVARSTGKDWIVDLPAEWKVQPLKHLVSVFGGATPSKDREDYWQGDIPWVSPKDMKMDLLVAASDYISLEALRNSPLVLVPAQSILIVVRGMILARHIPICRLNMPATINQDMKALIAKKSKINPDYLQVMLQGFQNVLMSFVEEAAHGTKKLRSEELFSLKFPVPPLAKQIDIVERLSMVSQQVARSNALIEQSIDRLKEYRSALITAAVTGQIDVSTYAKSGTPDRRLDAIQKEMGA